MAIFLQFVLPELVSGLVVLIVALINRTTMKKINSISDLLNSKEVRDVSYNRLGLLAVGKMLVRTPDVDTEDIQNWYTAYHQYESDCEAFKVQNDAMRALKQAIDDKYKSLIKE